MNISEVNYKTNFGGRPAMISSSTGAMALLMVTLVKDYGLKYLGFEEQRNSKRR